MSSSFVPNEETDFIPENILLTGGAGKYQCFYMCYVSGVYIGYHFLWLYTAITTYFIKKFHLTCTLTIMSLSYVSSFTILGFIGSHAAILLAKKYPHYKVVVYDKLDYCSCLANLDEISRLKNFKFVKGDISSPDLVSYVMTEEKIDTVMHFAAQTHVDNSFGNSFNFTQSNIFGTHVLLEAAKIHKGIKRFIHVSTDEVYGEGESFETEAMKEEHILEPTNPYAATKR